jgi:hypothetical protein
MGKKVISYCLYGNKLKYCHGMIESVISSNLHFLDWEVRVYYSTGKQAVPQSVINILKNLNCILIPYSEINTKIHGEDIEGMYRRFTPLGESDVDYWISRDSDSRSSVRELKMVNEWLTSNKAVHSILDHPCHGNLMGGTFGISNKILRDKYPGKIIDMSEHITNMASKQILRRGNDQNWIGNHFMDIVINHKDILVHLNEKNDCVKRCHVGGKRPITEHFETILVPHNPNFCGRQINYVPRTLSRPCVEIEHLDMSGTIV